MTLLRVTLSTEELIQPLTLSAFFAKSKLSAVFSTWPSCRSCPPPPAWRSRPRLRPPSPSYRPAGRCPQPWHPWARQPLPSACPESEQFLWGFWPWPPQTYPAELEREKEGILLLYSCVSLQYIKNSIWLTFLWMDLTLSWHGFSHGNICLRPLPSALSTSRTERTSSVSSEGTREAAWSLPFHVLSRVMWRSMTFAPRATAATEILIPDSWPEYPMGISGNSFWYSCRWQVVETSVTLKGII